MKKVFITQIPNRRDPVTKAFVPTVDVSPATAHGELDIMMPPQAAFHATADLVKQLTERLADYDYERGDSVMALGDPAIIAVTFAILGKTRGKFTILKWDRILGQYIPTKIVLN